MKHRRSGCLLVRAWCARWFVYQACQMRVCQESGGGSMWCLKQLIDWPNPQRQRKEKKCSLWLSELCSLKDCLCLCTVILKAAGKLAEELWGFLNSGSLENLFDLISKLKKDHLKFYGVVLNIETVFGNLKWPCWPVRCKQEFIVEYFEIFKWHNSIGNKR